MTLATTPSAWLVESLHAVSHTQLCVPLILSNVADRSTQTSLLHLETASGKLTLLMASKVSLSAGSQLSSDTERKGSESLDSMKCSKMSTEVPLERRQTSIRLSDSWYHPHVPRSSPTAFFAPGKLSKSKCRQPSQALSQSQPAKDGQR